MVQVAR